MAASSSKVLTQKVRGFTVQVRDPESDAIIGTGFVVSLVGQVVTCAHVVGDREEVAIYFPQVEFHEKASRRATIDGSFAEHDDDVILLRLVEDPPPLRPENVAILGPAEEESERLFRSYGYRRLDNHVGASQWGQF